MDVAHLVKAREILFEDTRDRNRKVMEALTVVAPYDLAAALLDRDQSESNMISRASIESGTDTAGRALRIRAGVDLSLLI